MGIAEEQAAMKQMAKNSGGDGGALDDLPDEEFNMDFPRGPEEHATERPAAQAESETVSSDSDDDVDAQLSDSELKALQKPGAPATGEGEVAKSADGASSNDTPAAQAASAAADTAASTTTDAGKPAAQTEQPKSAAPQAAAAEPGATEAALSPAASAAPAAVPSEAQIGEVYNQWRRESEELLATEHYAIPEEELAEFEREPAKVIPRLMSRVYMDSVTAAIGQLTTHLPNMVRLIIEENAKYDAASNNFFERWPQLKEHEEDVRKQGVVFRRMFPQASEEDFINNVGASVMIAKRLDPTAGQVKTPGKAKPGNGQVQVQTPATAPAFVPAAAASAAPSARTPNPADENVFTRLNQEFSEDVDDF